MRPPIDQAIAFYPTNKLQETRQFYEETVGLRVVVDQGDCIVLKVCPDAYLGFCRNDNPPGEDHRIVFTLVSNEVDAWHERLSQAGAEILFPPKDNPKYRIYNFFAKDPNGYLLEIQRFWDDNWRE